MDTRKTIPGLKSVCAALITAGKSVFGTIKKAGRFTADAIRWSVLSARFQYLSHIRDIRFTDLGKMSYATFVATNTVPKESVKNLVDDIYSLEKKMNEVEKQRTAIKTRANNHFPGSE